MHIMLSFLLIGMAFFILDQKQLMICSLAACGLLCIFLKDASHEALFYSRINEEDVFKVMHINAASAERQYEEVEDLIKTHKPDLLSIQECTPDWFYFFDKSIDTYSYRHHITLPMSFGSVLFSKYPIEPVDTIYINQVPNLVSEVKLKDNNKVTVLNTYLHSPQIKNDSVSVQNNLYHFTSLIHSRPESAFLHVGDFHLTYWSGHILDYRLESKLHNSRKGIDLSKMYVPYDHIFYSDQLECTKFEDIELSNKQHVGIIGEYYFKYSSSEEKDAFSSKIIRF